jgi:hypothetical protein
VRTAPLEATGPLTVVAPECFQDSLRDALERHRFRLQVRERPTDRGGEDPYGVRELAQSLDGSNESVLLVVPTGRSLERVAAGPVLDGVPIGLLPADDPGDLDAWLDSLRPASRPIRAWGVLAMGTDQYLGPAAELHSCLRENVADSSVTVHDWRANRIDRPTLWATLARGPALGIYLGHATPSGWGGYQGCDWTDVTSVSQERSIGALVNLACETLGGQESFGVRFLRSGRARAVIGLSGEVPVDDVCAISRLVGQTLGTDTPVTAGRILATVYASAGESIRAVLDRVRLVGLPVQPLY